MTINERIVEIRLCLDIRQYEMSDKIGLQRGSLSDIERGKTKTVTDRVIKDICREYNVSEHWLRTGEGEMFHSESREVEFERIWTQITLSNTENADIIKRIMKSFWSLSEDKQTVIREFIENIHEIKES